MQNQDSKLVSSGAGGAVNSQHRSTTLARVVPNTKSRMRLPDR